MTLYKKKVLCSLRIAEKRLSARASEIKTSVSRIAVPDAVSRLFPRRINDFSTAANDGLRSGGNI